MGLYLNQSRVRVILTGLLLTLILLVGWFISVQATIDSPISAQARNTISQDQMAAIIGAHSLLLINSSAGQMELYLPIIIRKRAG